MLSRGVSAWISDTLMERLNQTAGALGLRDDLFTSMRDEDGDGVPEPSSHFIRKAAHVTEFAVFTALLWLRLETGGRRRDLLAFAGGTAVGAVDELIQLFSHRGSQLKDVGIDAAGAALGVALCLLGAWWLARRRSRRKVAAEE